jgi:hypothetical protein
MVVDVVDCLGIQNFLNLHLLMDFSVVVDEVAAVREVWVTEESVHEFGVDITCC